mmetsp:Transcript_5339/g.7959  ORF Transcript_5339/g.7959 Transcript_5339/m.7959 type:complete len:563 (+) Transcript_5339:46-1734(+)
MGAMRRCVSAAAVVCSGGSSQQSAPKNMVRKVLKKPRIQCAAAVAFILILCTVSFTFVDETMIEETAFNLRDLFKVERNSYGQVINRSNIIAPSWEREEATYTKDDVLQTQLLFYPNEGNLLMIFDSDSGKFYTYNDPSIFDKSHPQTINFMLVQSLYANFPDRFRPGAPPFQLLFSAADYPSIDLKKTQIPADSKYAPVLQFGTVLSTGMSPLLDPIPIKEMPSSKIIGCLAKLGLNLHIRGGCDSDDNFFQSWSDQENEPLWKDLKPQLIWRGSDETFLDRFNILFKPGYAEDFPIVYDNKQSVLDSLMSVYDMLLPRWRAVTLSLEADVNAQANGYSEPPWFDAKFITKNLGGEGQFHPFLEAGANIITDGVLAHKQLLNYKYHIDLSGESGTAWLETLSKMAMPGVLFHHKTYARDWFFDDIEPFVHYIPVKMNLSDLREKFEWAESHPEEAEAISKAASDFVKRMTTKEYLEKVFSTYFVHYLGKIVKAYRPTAGGSETLENIKKAYESYGMMLETYSRCDEKHCVNGWDGYVFPENSDIGVFDHGKTDNDLTEMSE